MTGREMGGGGGSDGEGDGRRGVIGIERGGRCDGEEGV